MFGQKELWNIKEKSSWKQFDPNISSAHDSNDSGQESLQENNFASNWEFKVSAKTGGFPGMFAREGKVFIQNLQDLSALLGPPTPVYSFACLIE